MISLSLPCFFDLYVINNAFSINVKEYKEYLKVPITVSDSYGNYPYTYHNGGYNNNFGERPLYREYSDVPMQQCYSLRFDCSNVYLDTHDYQDTLINIILPLGDNGSNKIEVSSLSFYDYLKEHYPNYHYIFSSNGDYIHSLNNEIIEILQEKFDLIGVPPYYDFNELNKLSHKNKIEILIGDNCLSNCQYYRQCHLEEQQAQLNFSSFSPLRNCKTISKENIHNSANIDYLEEMEKYIKCGFSHFKISPPNNVKIYEYALYNSFFTADGVKKIYESNKSVGGYN